MAARVSKFLLLLLLGAGSVHAQSGLDARQFKKYWQVESESPDYRLTFLGDTAEVLSPKGLTLWRKQKLQAGVAVEYDACIMDEGREGDRLSDMNVFWLASDPAAKDIWARANWRSGIFLRCYSLQMYYLGYGGNQNSTTRFRRYTGDERGIDSAAFRPTILKEYTDKAHLLRPNHWYHIRIETANGHTRMSVDGEQLIDYFDPQPLREGWFGFRTTWSRVRLTNFRIEPVNPFSAKEGIPLHWVTEQTLTPAAGSRPQMLGIPFAQGELKDASRLVLSNGTPVDAWANATWPDGSVKWAGLAAVVPNGETLKVQHSSMKPAKIELMVQETAGEIIVSTDRLRAFIPKQGRAIIDSIQLADGSTVATATQLLADDATGQISQATVERSGRVLTVVRLEGRHANARRTWLPFVVRLYFFRGSDRIKMVHSFVYDGDEQTDRIQTLGIRFHVPMRGELYNRHIAFATDDGGVWAEPVQPLTGRRKLSDGQAGRKQLAGERIPPFDTFNEKDRHLLTHWAAWDGFRLSQLTDNSFAVRKRATAESPWIGTFTGVRAPGYAFVGDVDGGLSVGLQDFWQSYPSTLQVDNARSREAALTVWLWSPEAEPMNLCHYDTVAHDLQASYEDVQPGMSTPYGIARTSTLWLIPEKNYPGKAAVASQAAQLADDAHLLPTPEYLHQKQAFGLWSLPEKTGKVEERLAQYLNFYQQAIEQNKWYGFWNYGDMMHAYDPDRHSWQYDVGGYAWDNTELATPMWLWYSFLRTGSPAVWRMAEAMTRHNSEVDTYHLGPFAPLGSRHNVSHWGCGAKEARISQSAFLRFYYYLTCDDRTGDLMHAQTDADTLLYHLDPMRLAEPRSQFPCTAPARLRLGPDWLAYAGNWLTEWERTGNEKYRNKIVTGLESITQLRHGFFTGNLALGYDPATGRISYEGDPNRMTTNHLATIMGGFEVMNELQASLPSPAFQKVYLDYALNYKRLALEIRNNRFPVRRLMAYAAWQTRSPQLTAEAWHDLWNRIEHEQAPKFSISPILPPEVPAPLDEWQGLSTNDAALWSLDAIYMQEVLP